MTVGFVRLVLSDGLIHLAYPGAPLALCGARRRAPGDLAASDAAVGCEACLGVTRNALTVNERIARIERIQTERRRR